MSSEPEVKNQSRPITGLLSLSNTAKHGIISLTLVLLLSPAIPHAAAQSSPDSNNQYPYTNFSPSMAIIIVVLIAALFFMGFFSIYIRHCTESRSGTVRPVAGVATGRSRRGMRGLAPEVLENFPIFVYSEIKNHKIGKSALECAVCLNEFQDDETLRLLPKCDHVFHPDCIDAWLSSHTTCPVCRANLEIPADGATAGEYTLPVHEPESDSDESTHRPDADELQNSVSIRVVEDQNGDQALLSGPPELIKPSRSLNQSRSTRSRSIKTRIFSKFPRSHSTGHSLIQPGENVERFTLRLPEEVRKQIVNRKLNRATSLVVLPREGSSRRGYRTGGEGSSRGKKRLERLPTDRWVFSMTPPFFTRAPSIRSPRVVANDGSIRSPRVAANDGEGTSSMPPPAKGLNAV